MKKQGSFVNELKEIRGAQSVAKPKFIWDNDIATPFKDTAHPRADLSKTSQKGAEKESKEAQPKPGADTPKKLNGAVDTKAMRDDLTAQLKSQRKR